MDYVGTHGIHGYPWNPWAMESMATHGSLGTHGFHADYIWEYIFPDLGIYISPAQNTNNICKLLCYDCRFVFRISRQISKCGFAYSFFGWIGRCNMLVLEQGTIGIISEPPPGGGPDEPGDDEESDEDEEGAE